MCVCQQSEVTAESIDNHKEHIRPTLMEQAQERLAVGCPLKERKKGKKHLVKMGSPAFNPALCMMQRN